MITELDTDLMTAMLQRDEARKQRDALKSENAELRAALEEIERMTVNRSGTLTKATHEIAAAALSKSRD